MLEHKWIIIHIFYMVVTFITLYLNGLFLRHHWCISNTSWNMSIYPILKIVWKVQNLWLNTVWLFGSIQIDLYVRVSTSRSGLKPIVQTCINHVFCWFKLSIVTQTLICSCWWTAFMIGYKWLSCGLFKLCKAEPN